MPGGYDGSFGFEHLGRLWRIRSAVEEFAVAQRFWELNDQWRFPQRWFTGMGDESTMHIDILEVLTAQPYRHHELPVQFMEDGLLCLRCALSVTVARPNVNAYLRRVGCQGWLVWCEKPGLSGISLSQSIRFAQLAVAFHLPTSMLAPKFERFQFMA